MPPLFGGKYVEIRVWGLSRWYTLETYSLSCAWFSGFTNNMMSLPSCRSMFSSTKATIGFPATGTRYLQQLSLTGERFPPLELQSSTT